MISIHKNWYLRGSPSLSVLIQQVGRVLRIFTGKKIATILDHVGNCRRHDFFPDDVMEWSLTSKNRAKDPSGESGEHARQCAECYHWHRPAPICPKCGFTYPTKPRIVEEVDGQLTKYERGSGPQKTADWDLINAKTRDQLESLAVARGYKSPTVWAEIRLAARQKRKPDFKVAMARRRFGLIG